MNNLSRARRPVRDRTAPDRFNRSEETANSKERGRRAKEVANSKERGRQTPSHFKEGREPQRVKAKRSKYPVASQNSDWMLLAQYFKWLHETYGPFDVDACCNDDGSNKQPECAEHSSEKRSCFTQDWDGKRVYCNPPYEKEFVRGRFVQAVQRSKGT